MLQIVGSEDYPILYPETPPMTIRFDRDLPDFLAWAIMPRIRDTLFGAWRSPVARLNGVQEVPSSNLGAPTNKKTSWLVKPGCFFSSTRRNTGGGRDRVYGWYTTKLSNNTSAPATSYEPAMIPTSPLVNSESLTEVIN